MAELHKAQLAVATSADQPVRVVTDPVFGWSAGGTAAASPACHRVAVLTNSYKATFPLNL